MLLTRLTFLKDIPVKSTEIRINNYTKVMRKCIRLPPAKWCDILRT